MERKAAMDPELREEAVRLRLAIDPTFGEEAQVVITKLYASPPELVTRARNLVRISDQK